MDMGYFWKVVNDMRPSNQNWREGQLYYNAYCKVNPSVGSWVTGKEMDPFYDDLKIPLFLEFIEKIP